MSIRPNNLRRIDGSRLRLFFPMAHSRKDCIYGPHVELSRPVSRAFARPGFSLVSILLAAFTIGDLATTPLRAQDMVVATVNPSGPADPNASIAPEQSIDLTTDVNPPLPVASTDEPVESTPATNIDSGIPRRFHYRLQLSVRTVYDDNINLLESNPISDIYTSIEPGIMLGFGDTEGRTENFLRLDYLPAVFIFADHSENDSVQHVFRLDGQYRINRLTLTLSQMVQIMDGVDVQAQDSAGGLEQQVNLDVAGRTRFNIYSTHFNAAYYVTGKTFLSGGADFTATQYSSLISSEVISGNFYLNYDFSPKVVLGLGGVVGHDEVDDPNPDQTFEQINLRATYQATGKIDFAGSVGVEVRHFEGDTRDEHVSPIFELGMRYTPFDGTKISLTASSHILNSAVLAAENYMVTNISGGVQQRLFQRVFLGVNAGYEHSDYFSTVAATGSNRNDDYFYVQPSIAVSVTRFWTVGAYYLHRENSSTLDGFDFHDNQVGLRSTLEF